MIQVKRGTTKNLMIYMLQSADHVSGATGLTLTVTLSKDGGAFASLPPLTVTERGNGWYNLALTTDHTDTLGTLSIYITASGADPGKYQIEVTEVDPLAPATYGDVSTVWDSVIEDTYTAQDYMRGFASVLLWLTSGHLSRNPVFKAANGIKNRVTTVFDQDGRSSVIFDPTD